MADISDLIQICNGYLKTLCVDIHERCVGSEGNRKATYFCNDVLTSFGWKTEMPEFEAMDWIDGGASLSGSGVDFSVNVSPYSRGCTAEAILTGAETIEELQNLEFTDRILLLHGDIAGEQLMPKNFMFYNPEEHQRIISLLETGNPKAIICATSRNPALAGGVYPFPLIEDGDFDIPSVYMTEEEGRRLEDCIGKTVSIDSRSERIMGKGFNVIGRRGIKGSNRIVITAHIDAKKGTPGAIDNATGVSILLLLAQLLNEYSGKNEIEIVAFNGEDYFAVPGQMNYIRSNKNRFSNIMLNINIDGAGYRQGKSSFSLFGLPDDLHRKTIDTLAEHSEIREGIQWPQGDHSIFVQHGRPAIAVSSQWFIENIENQEITHTPNDSIEIVDTRKVVTLALAIKSLIMKIQ